MVVRTVISLPVHYVTKMKYVLGLKQEEVICSFKREKDSTSTIACVQLLKPFV